MNRLFLGAQLSILFLPGRYFRELLKKEGISDMATQIWHGSGIKGVDS